MDFQQLKIYFVADVLHISYSAPGTWRSSFHGRTWQVAYEPSAHRSAWPSFQKLVHNQSHHGNVINLQ